jgi:pimeloyl-ACP methyl ester carboxylesterase
MNQFEKDGRVLSYLASRPAGEISGTLVLLHAFPLSAAMWEGQLSAAPASWRVVAPDLAGFGRSFPLPPGATFDDDARDVVALLDHLHEESAVIAGLSMGGYVAFALARTTPHRMRGLVLADTRADADTEEARRSRLQMLATLDSGGTAAVVDGMLPRLLGETTRSTRPDVVSRVREMAVAQPAHGFAAAIRRLMGRPDSTHLLSTLGFPTLVIAGAEDVISGADVAWRMQRQIGGAELAIIERAGHLSNIEQPGPFNSALYGFMERRFG